MRDKKKSQAKKTSEQEALEKHVDAIMDPKQPDTPAAKKPEPAISAAAAPVAQSTPTAPQLSPKLRKQVDVAGESGKPLSIDKLDELTEQITKSAKSKKPKKPEKETGLETAVEPAEPEESPAPADITEESAGLDDPQTDKAVDDIVAYEGDVMLAVADSTAEEHNRQIAEQTKPKGHPALAVIFWIFIAIAVFIIIALGVLLVMGDNLANKLGI